MKIRIEVELDTDRDADEIELVEKIREKATEVMDDE